MPTQLDTCGPTCPLETVTLRALKDEESGRIRSDQTLAENIDNLAGAYARLAVRYDDLSDFAQRAWDLLTRLEETQANVETRLRAIERKLDKIQSLKWWVGIIIGGATLGGQIAAAFIK